MITATEEVDTQKQKLRLEEEKLTEVKDQLNKSRIYAPSSGLVVYHVGESSRYGGSSGIIEKGATLRKGQDIIHLPDLSKMKVQLKIHESRINQVKPGLQVQISHRHHRRPHLPWQDHLRRPRGRRRRALGQRQKSFQVRSLHLRQTAPLHSPRRLGHLPHLRGQPAEDSHGGRQKIKTLRVPIQSVVTTVEGRRVCFKMNKKNQPVPVPVETGYYDQTHIQITTGLALGDTILKAPLLHAKELNVGGGLFGYRQINADDFFKDLPETVEPAKPTPSSTSGEPQPSTAQKAPPHQRGARQRSARRRLRPFQ